MGLAGVFGIWRGTARVWRLRHAWQPRFVLTGSALVLVATHVIGLGSITVQCRQRVNTPCHRPMRTEALMNVQKTFLVLLASTKRTRLPGRDPAAWQFTPRTTKRAGRCETRPCPSLYVHRPPQRPQRRLLHRLP